MNRHARAVREPHRGKRWRPLAMGIVAVLTTTLIGVTQGVPAATAAAGDPFDPATPTVFVAQGEDSTQLHRAETTGDGTFAFQPEGGASSASYNAVAFNPADNYIYGMAPRAQGGIPAGALVRIGQGGVVTRVGNRVYSHPDTGSTRWFQGAFNPADGFFYVADSAPSTDLLVLNVANGNIVRRIDLAIVLETNDFVFKDGYAWGMSTSGDMRRINVASGAVRTFPGILPDAPLGYGGAWLFGNDNLGFSNNGNGRVYQIAVDNGGSNSPSFRIVSVVPGPASNFNDGTAIPGLPADLSLQKSGPSRIVGGGRISYDITVTNNGAGFSSGWTVSDTLPAGLTNPSVQGSVTPTIDGSTITVAGGSLRPGTSTTFTVSADAAPAPGGCVTNLASVTGNEEDPNSSNNQDDAVTCAPALQISKTSDAGQNASVGQIVRYAVTLRNTGSVPFDASLPASFTDDLSNVLDDATYRNDASVSFSQGTTGSAPTLDGRTLRWSGSLQAGETATFRYSVTLTNAGNGAVVNNACIPSNVAQGNTCASTRTELPKLTIAKTSDPTEISRNGGVVTYRVTVTNRGPGDATGSNPARFTDDLSRVLDDAVFVEGSLSATSGTASRNGNTLSWQGTLTDGASSTVTYRVNYDAKMSGNKRLVNVACIPTDLAANPAEACRQVDVPGAVLQQWKTSDPSSGTVVAGDEITYTLHFLNTGQAAASIDNADDLSRVLDDADLVSGPTSSDAALRAARDGNVVRVSGAVAPGREQTVSYTVRVRPDAARGDDVLVNALAECDADDRSLCAPIEHRIPHLAVVKSSDVATTRTGDTVTYSVRATNDGSAAFSDADPASFTDDLSGVLDDAVYGDDAAASSGEVSYDAPVISWEGPLDPGESVTVTYTVTVTNVGDHQLLNTACAVNAGEDPSCVTNTVLMPHFVASKSVDPEDGSRVDAGQIVTYTLAFLNDGTAAGDLSYRDDLSGVLDDADFGDGPTASDPSLTATRDADVITIDGTLTPGQSEEVAYTVTVKPDGTRGDNQLGNVLAETGNDDPDCDDPRVACTSNPVSELTAWKTVDPASGTSLRAGDEATYTLHFESTGKAPVTVDRDDVLTKLLDDADITRAPVSTNDALEVSPVDDGRFTVTGELVPGAGGVVTYTVVVKPDGLRGDDQLDNFLVPHGEAPPESCVPVDGQPPSCTVNYVSDVTVVKTVDPASGTQVRPWQNVTYTLTFTNRSQSSAAPPAEIDYTDHMSDVLDDARLFGSPVSSHDSLVASASGNDIRIRGSIPTGEVYTVRYTVTVKPYADQRNHHLGNVVAMTGTDPICAPQSPLCTSNDIVPGLATTGGEAPIPALWAGIGMLLAGLAITWMGRRRFDRA